jgi:putative nucleotidyltransferase with HDIG domain
VHIVVRDLGRSRHMPLTWPLLVPLDEMEHLRRRALVLVDGLDSALAGHALRVAALAMGVADELGVDAVVRRDAELGALLHDVGKLCIPPAILAKQGPLDRWERELIRTHVTEGERLAGSVEDMPASVAAVVRASHERWDGGGYPDGLAGEQIPLAARIVAAADTFDAMTSRRCYRPALSRAIAVEVVLVQAGFQFDPEVAWALARVAGR